MEDTHGKFYLGRIFDPGLGKTTNQPLLYDSADLNTHAVVVGMTGSGKTGLCIGLLEEAALAGVPALMIDPKGDITNLLLHFPELLPADFQPWINPDEVRRANKTVEQAAQEASELWTRGLTEWDIHPERIQALKDAAHFAVYTPGSDAGIPVSILASLKAPEIPWEGNREILRERIASTVTALLGLVGLDDIDPVRSREHILLSNIFENAWSQAQDLHLDELILRTQNPPFSKLGVFDINTFFPEKDRFQLAMLLNNILAAPAFQTWVEGVPLDIPSLLYHPDGRPRHNVFYIAHLSDSERMFFVTLLFSAVETWMRSQSGSGSLRALVYFDEILGYLPPTNNPPSKQPILRMLKQARAFGVGLVLVTQNPVDVDYKGLSNAGTWLIGKLQTERDKARLLDGLEGAMQGGVDRLGVDRMISTLGKRVFLMNNIHGSGPVLFQTRWAMNYMAGPMTRSQIPDLNKLVAADRDAPGVVSLVAGQSVTRPADPNAALDAAQVGPAIAGAAAVPNQPGGPSAAKPVGPPAIGVGDRPSIPTGIKEIFLPVNVALNEALQRSGKTPDPGSKNLGVIYYPTVLAQAQVRYLNRKYNLDQEKVQAALVYTLNQRGVVRWEDFVTDPVDLALLEDQPAPGGRFMTLKPPFGELKVLKALEKDFMDWVYRTSQASVRANETLKVYAGPQVSSNEFNQMCADAARKNRDAEIKKSVVTLDRQIRDLENKLAREQRELQMDQAELSQRKNEELGNIFNIFTGDRRRNRLSSTMSKRRMAGQAKADVDESNAAIAQYKQQIAEREAEKGRLEQEITNRWGQIAKQVSEIPVTPLKKDILLELFGVAWLPCYIVQTGEQSEALRAYASPSV
jgi:hypothetical protein